MTGSRAAISTAIGTPPDIQARNSGPFSDALLLSTEAAIPERRAAIKYPVSFFILAPVLEQRVEDVALTDANQLQRLSHVKDLLCRVAGAG
jgi:hypothetical protein